MISNPAKRHRSVKHIHIFIEVGKMWDFTHF